MTIRCRKCGTTNPDDFYPTLRSICRECKLAATVQRRRKQTCVVCGVQLRNQPHQCRNLNPVPDRLTCDCCRARHATYADLRRHRADTGHWMRDTFAPEPRPNRTQHFT